MSFLKLSWCQLIRIILSQIGGNPLQQMYSQLNQGLATMSPRSGIIPKELTEIKQLIEQVTSAIQTAQTTANDFTDTLDRITNQFFQNPVGSISSATMISANTRISAINTLLATESDSQIIASLTEERTALSNTVTFLSSFKNNTDRLSGVSPITNGGAGGCSLQDLLGSGCAPNNDVPDIDLQNLLDSLKQGDAIAAIKQNIENASGVSNLKQSLSSFNTTISGFNASFTASITKASIRNAVSSQVTQIAFNLLSGCGNQVFDLTLKSNVKGKVAAWAALLEKERSGEITYGPDGEAFSYNSPIYSPISSNAIIYTNLTG